MHLGQTVFNPLIDFVHLPVSLSFFSFFSPLHSGFPSSRFLWGGDGEGGILSGHCSWVRRVFLFQGLVDEDRLTKLLWETVLSKYDFLYCVVLLDITEIF